MSLRRMILPFILAIVALLGVTATAAQAAPYQYYGAESYNPTAGASAFTQFYAAHSAYIISIQYNHVNCPAYNGAHVTWCGTVGNNTGHAQAGVNYTVGGAAYWMRMDVYAAAVAGYLKCTTRGNAPSHFVNACAGVAQ